jgi:hypothetical protein
MPQFTVNSGLLGVAGILGILCYIKTGQKRHLITALMLCFYSYLIRNQEFYFVVIVSLPLLLNRKLVTDRRFLIWISIFTIICVIAGYVNFVSLHMPSLNAYNAFKKVCYSLVDYGGGQYLLLHPDLLAKYNYTVNDINLLASWFFADKQISNPVLLGILLSHYNFLTHLIVNYKLGIIALRALFDTQILPLTCLSIMGIILSKQKLKLLSLFMLFTICIVILGLLGRPAVLRVYYPIMALLTIIALLYIARPNYYVCLVIISTVFMIKQQYFLNQERLEIARLTTKDVSEAISSEKLVVEWAGEFPFEYYYLPLQRIKTNIHIYSLGGFFYLPNTYASNGEVTNNSIVNWLVQAKNIDIITNEGAIRLLSTYCEEHLKKHLKINNINKLKTFTIYNISCQ